MNNCDCCEDKQTIIKSVLIGDLGKNDQFALKNQTDSSEYKLKSQDLFHI